MPIDLSAIAENLNRIDGSGGSYVWLLQVDFEDNSTVRITNNQVALILDENEYQPYPLSVGQIREDGEGEVSGVPLTVWDGDGVLVSMVEGYRGFDKWRVILSLAHVIDDIVTVCVSHRFGVNDLTTESGRVTMMLGDEEINSAEIPHNYFDPDVCQVPYRGERCGYSGPFPTCDRSLWGGNGCAHHFPETPIKPFRGVPGLRSLI